MKEIYLKIARQAIKAHLYQHDTINRDALIEKYPELSQEGATFVTLSIQGNLRGCIGSLAAHRTLIDDIISNARSAAFHDPRFMPLKRKELSKVEIEVSLLSPPKELTYTSIQELKNKITIGIDGVVLRSNGRHATFLPQVWEELQSFELFFMHLCQKADHRSSPLS